MQQKHRKQRLRGLVMMLRGRELSYQALGPWFAPQLERKKKRLSMVVHTCNLSTGEAKAGRS
jgi:hypothetical protein